MSGIDIDNRTIYLHKQIDAKICGKIVKYLRYLDAAPGPIYLDINCEGGDTTSGLMLCHEIELCANDVVAVVSGAAQSMAFVVVQVCDQRLVYPHASLMYHHGTRAAPQERNYFEHEAEATGDREQSDIIDRIVYAHSPVQSGFHEFQIDALKSFFMTGTEAVAAGWADKVVRYV